MSRLKKIKRKGKKNKGKGEEGGIGPEAGEGRDVVKVPTTAASSSQQQGREPTPEEKHEAERRRVLLKPCETREIDEIKGMMKPSRMARKMKRKRRMKARTRP